MKYYRNQDCFRLTFFLLILLVSGVAKAASYTPPEKSVSALKGIDFSRATPIDESYRAKFERCDRKDIFILSFRIRSQEISILTMHWKK